MSRGLATAIRMGVLVVAGAGALAGAWAYKASEKVKVGEIVRAELRRELGAAPLDETRAAYLDALVDHFHARGFDAAFEPRGLTGGTADQARYNAVMLARMIEHAERDGAGDVAAGLREFALAREIDLTP